MTDCKQAGHLWTTPPSRHAALKDRNQPRRCLRCGATQIEDKRSTEGGAMYLTGGGADLNSPYLPKADEILMLRQGGRRFVSRDGVTRKVVRVKAGSRHV